MQDFEKLGAFYLGKIFDMEQRTTREDLLLYDSKDLTTHAVCVGMTGSGKTGLCLSLLEEAAIDGIPAICIDPKGDLGNLLLGFPDLLPENFLPWIDPGEATRQGCTVEQYAQRVAQRWREGLAEWGQDGARIARYRAATDLTIYTPGSNSGIPLSMLRSFEPPDAAILQDAEAFRECIQTAVAGLLALLRIDADPLTSREHILLANILDRAWREGRSLDLGALIREIQTPPIDKIGVMDLETIFPAKDRFALAMQLNNLLGAPGFSTWLEGEPLDIHGLLHTKSGQPRVSIISIAHLNDAERMFFVTTLLNALVAWMRGQTGTTSLRAILYMDEVFGYFPPTANPPSKLPMLTLLKQARAFGLGVVLATQNPVDLDYKGLANAGTWFLGRLQTERDKARVLEGLEGASATAGGAFDRARMEAILAGLGNRVFVMNNVHDDHPVVFQSRWALSYLRGPISRGQIETLMKDKKAARMATGVATGVALTQASSTGQHPVLPPGIDELFLMPNRRATANERLVYRPAVLGVARVHFVRASDRLDEWETVALLAALQQDAPDDIWSIAKQVSHVDWELGAQPDTVASYADLPSAWSQAKLYAAAKVSLKNHLYQHHTRELFECAALKLKSLPSETEGDFRVRLTQAAHERRDLEIEKLRKKYTPKLTSIEERIRKARQRVEQQKQQVSQQTWTTALTVGTTVLGALFGRKLTSASNVNRAATSMRSASKIARDKGNVNRAEENVESLHKQLEALEAEFTVETEQLSEHFTADALALKAIPLSPRKADLAVDQVALVWTPWIVDAIGVATPAYE